MGEIQRKITHVEEARDRLLSQFRGRLERDLDPVSTQVQELEDANWQFLTLRGIGSATGHTLDLLGKIVGEDREGQADPLYRIRIRARIQANLSDGTWDDLHRVMAILLDTAWPPPGLDAIDLYPAGFIYKVEGVVFTADQLAILARFLKQIRGAAIEARLGYTTGLLSDAFAFAVASTLAAVAPVGSTSLQILTPAIFPSFGQVTIGIGASKETLSYTGLAGNFLTGVTATGFLHSVGDPVSLVSPATGKGYSDTANPTSGGAYAGLLVV